MRIHRLMIPLLITVLTVVVSSGCDSLEPPEPPYLNRFESSRSPHGRYVATFYGFGGGGSGFLGATVSRPLYVNVLPVDQSFDPRQGQALAIRHGHQIRFQWVNEERLIVTYPRSAAVEKQVAQVGRVQILFRAIPTLNGKFVEPKSEIQKQ